MLEMDKAYTANFEVQVLQGIVFGLGDNEKISRVIEGRAGCRLVLVEGVFGH